MKQFTLTLALLALATGASALEFAPGDQGVNPDGSTYIVSAGAPVLPIDQRGGSDN